MTGTAPANRRFQPLVLCYHAVSNRWDHPLAVRLPMLELQLRSLLARRYRPVAVADVVEGRGRVLHVTFDDAFRSMRAALPVLERLGIPATVFVCAEYARDGHVFPVSDLDGGARTDEEELATMAWEELRDLSEHGLTIGSHTMSHPHLPTLSDAALRSELSDSREQVEAQLHRPCRYISYPYGEHDDRVRVAARAAGYDAAFALPGRQRPIDPFALPRVGVWRNDGSLRVAVKTSIARPSSPTVQRLLGRS
jgi:peptidoglycan/xylan/chitin deacetylase (PgdA/CDA1 family)